MEKTESDEEVDGDLARSRLLIPPPKERRAVYPTHDIRDEDDGANDGSENDAPALPVPHRRSMDMRASRPIPAIQSDGSEPDTDHDGQPLPIPPRPITRLPPPPLSRESSQNEDEEPRNESINIPTLFPLDREIMDEDEGGTFLLSYPCTI